MSFLAILAAALNRVSAQPLPRQQRDNDNGDISLRLGPILVGLGANLAIRSAKPALAEDENAIKQRDDDDDVTVSLGPIHVGAATGLLAVRSAKPAIAGDETALKRRDNDDDDINDRSIDDNNNDDDDTLTSSSSSHPTLTHYATHLVSASHPRCIARSSTQRNPLPSRCTVSHASV